MIGPGSQVLARAQGVLGELVLRRRSATDGHPLDVSAVVELVSNGVFLMDTGDASTERRLADEVLARLAGSPLSVLVGGLGLGFTAAAALADPRVRRVHVVEIEPALVRWVRDGLVPQATGLLDDDRVEVVVGDVADVLRRWQGPLLDAVLLDVDNGPAFLTHPANEGLYADQGLGAARAALRPGGVLAVWSADPDPALEHRLARVLGGCDRVDLTVERQGRSLDYVLYAAVRR
ncbi:spermidine synthase [Thalassiella azotivora]